MERLNQIKIVRNIGSFKNINNDKPMVCCYKLVFNDNGTPKKSDNDNYFVSFAFAVAEGTRGIHQPTGAIKTLSTLLKETADVKNYGFPVDYTLIPIIIPEISNDIVFVLSENISFN